jgi:hypothetical protein
MARMTERSVRILLALCCALPVLAGSAVDARTRRNGHAGTGLHADRPWREMATILDRDRLRDWRKSWVAALAKVNASPDAAAIAGDSALFDPDTALPDATLPPGDYRCRVTKLGANGDGMRDVTRYPPVACPVTANGKAENLNFSTGIQRPGGMIFAEVPARSIFLGTLVLGDETKWLAYGEDDGRDMAGYIEKIGPARWRLVLPHPHFESLLDVVEITPAR